MARKTTTSQIPTPVADAPEAEVGAVELIKKPQLLDRVVTRTNLKKT